VEARSGRVAHAKKTMSETDISAAARLLLHERVHTFEQLEALVLLYGARGNARPESAIAEALKIPAEAAREALLELESRGLAAGERQEAAPRYRYSAGTTELDAAVRELVRAYHDNRLGVVRLMSDNAIHRMRTGAIRAFSDAFLIGRKKRDA
jgi:hypothetical protein